jgi:hypothetical protein
LLSAAVTSIREAKLNGLNKYFRAAAILASICLPGCLVAQTPTVLQKVFTNLTTAQTGGPGNFVVSGAIQNIGQAGHQAFLQLHNNGVSTCDPTQVSATLAMTGTFVGAGSTSFNIGNPGTVTTPPSASTVSTITQVGSGVYSTVNIITSIQGGAGAAANCAVDIWYTGSAYGIPPNPLIYSLSTIPNSGGISTGAAIVEKGPRTALISAPAVSVQATASIGNNSTQAAVIDCLTISAQVQTTLVATQITKFSIFNTVGPVDVWAIDVGFPNGTAAGNSFSQSICGLGIIVPKNTTYTAAFASGLTSIAEKVSLTYATVQ